MDILQKRGGIVLGWFMPDRVFAHFYDIMPEYLISCGIKALIIDIDNTLAPYEMSKPDEKTLVWFASLAEFGIKAALVSNNDVARVAIFNQELGLPAYSKSGKPFAKNLKKAMSQMGSDKTNTAMLGDQLLTDIAAGKHIGLRAFLVPPIKDRTSAFFRFKRALEVPTIKRYVNRSKNGGAAQICDFWINKRYRIK